MASLQSHSHVLCHVEYTGPACSFLRVYYHAVFSTPGTSTAHQAEPDRTRWNLCALSRFPHTGHGPSRQTGYSWLERSSTRDGRAATPHSPGRKLFQWPHHNCTQKQHFFICKNVISFLCMKCHSTNSSQIHLNPWSDIYILQLRHISTTEPGLQWMHRCVSLKQYHLTDCSQCMS